MDDAAVVPALVGSNVRLPPEDDNRRHTGLVSASAVASPTIPPPTIAYSKCTIPLFPWLRQGA